MWLMNDILYCICIGFLLLGVLPPKVQNHQVLFGALLDHLNKNGLFSGIQVEDSAGPEIHVVTRTIKLFVNGIVEDTRGLPNPVCCKQSPAHVGTCPWCTLPGITIGGKPCYIGAVTHLYRRYIFYLDV